MRGKETHNYSMYLTTHSVTFCLARKPRTAKTTRVASTDVRKLIPETVKASRWQLLFLGLYEE